MRVDRSDDAGLARTAGSRRRIGRCGVCFREGGYNKSRATAGNITVLKGDSQMLTRIVKFQTAMFHAKDSERGATAVEYGLMVALIAAIIVAAVGLLGQQILAAFETVTGELAPIAP